MEIDVIISAIGSLGFPIVVAIYMIYVNQQQAKAHASETKEMTTALNELKIVIQTLIDKMEG